MVQIHNTDLSKELTEGAKIQLSRDYLPNQLADKVVPVMEVNPKLMRRINVISGTSSVTTGSKTIYTTPAVAKDFFLTNVNCSFIKDAVCDVATGALLIGVVKDGATLYLASLPVITVTAQTGEINLNFGATPIKLDRNTTITFSGTFTLGVMVRSYSVQGFTIDNPNA